NQGRFQEAVTSFKEAIRIDPEFAEAYYNLGFALSKMGEYEEALKATKKALEINPYYTTNRLKLGIDLYADKLDILIGKELTKEVELEKEEPFEAVFAPQEEERIFEEVFEEEEEGPEVVEEVAEVQAPPKDYFAEGRELLERGELDRALEAFEEALRENPDNPEILYHIARIYYEKGLYGEAKERIVSLLERKEEKEYLKLAIDTGRKDNDPEFARKYLERALVLYPDDKELLEEAADFYEERGEYDKAIGILERLLPETNGEVLERLGRLYVEKGERERGKKLLEEAGERGSESALLFLSTLARDEGKKEEERRYLEKLLTVHPDHPEAVKKLAFILMEEEQYDRALSLAEKAKDLLPIDPDPLYIEGKIRYLKGDTELAKELLHDALLLKEDHAGAHLTLGIIYAKEGRIGEAIKAWEKVLEVAPESKEAKEAKRAIDAARTWASILGGLK
ncbi:hypothetical protein DRQ16_03375, partial [bacterium]